MEPLSPTDPHVVGAYRLIARVGSGGMGVVYLAEDEAGRQVALKLIRVELAEDSAFRARFAREVRAGTRVGGICTAKFLDADLVADRPYLVTEYVDGGNLQEYVESHGPLVGDQLVGLAVGLAEAVVAMHAVGVIHRDLKPSNVLMAANGPKVADFGISHAADATALTRSGVVVGSPAWMAPEQAIGLDTTPAVDVFAWGATVMFAATARSPFGEGRPDAVLYRVVHENADLSGIDRRLRSVVAAALAKDPAARPTPDNLLLRVVREAVPGVHVADPADMDDEATVALERTWRQTVGGPRSTGPRRADRRRRRVLAGALAIALIAIATGVSYAVANRTTVKSAAKTAPGAVTSRSTPATTALPQTPATTSTLALATEASTPSVSSAPASVSPRSGVVPTDSLPIVSCATSFGVDQSIPPLPRSKAVSVPAGLQSELAVYSDTEGVLQLLAPKGWQCTASIGANGSGSLEVYKAGAVDSAGHFLPNAQAIAGSETSACLSCAEEQACALFVNAAADYLRDYQANCPASRPAAESVYQIRPGIVGFEDPVGAHGSGEPSGGTFPANGVMTYYSASPGGSWLETCTLPNAEHSLCTAVLNNFVSVYGSY